MLPGDTLLVMLLLEVLRMDTLGNRIKQLREKLGLTQKELALRIGVARSSLASWEVGRREPDYEMLQKLADALDSNVQYLLTGKNGVSEIPDPWYERDTPPTEADLENIIKEHPNLRLFGNPLDEKTKEDVMLGLRIVWETLQKERAAKRQQK
jgi:transcriptional regulator with XRE-family HTH domain